MKEQIRPQSVLRGQQAAYMEDVQRYLRQRGEFVRRRCPGCNRMPGVDQLPFAVHHDFPFLRCKACWTVFMCPGPTDKMVDDFYRESENYKFWAEQIYPETAEARRLLLHVPRAEWVEQSWLEYVKGESQHVKKVLELGAGTGDTLGAVLSLFPEAEGTAVEPNPNMWPALKSQGFRVLPTRTEFLEGEVAHDIVMAFEVLEHVLNPITVLRKLHSMLKPNGLLLLSTPNAHSVEVQLLSSASTTLDVEHISVLTPAALHSLAARSGFKVLSIETPGKMDMDLIRDSKLEGELKKAVADVGRQLEGELVQNYLNLFGFSSHMNAVLAPTR